MGQLVFQANAGGQTALVGPNPSSNFSLNVPAVNGTLVTTGDTGTVTNTMLASNVYTAPGTIGSVTPNTGAFTTLSASSVTDSGLTAGRVNYNGTGGLLVDSSNLTFDGSTLNTLNSAYTGTLTGGTGIVNLGSGQFYKDASGNVGIGTSSPLGIFDVVKAGNQDMRIRSSNTGEAAIRFQNTTSGTTTSDGLYVGLSGSDGYLYNYESANLIFATSSTERMRIDSSGNLLVGTTSQVGFGKFCVLANSSSVNQVALQDSGTTYATNIGYINFTNSTGGQAGFIAHTTATTVAYLTTSDARLKENIVDAPSALNAIKNVKVRSYNWKEGKEKVTYGFVAQELYTEIPEVVGKGDDKAILENSGDVWQLEYGRLTPILFKAIQEQQALITDLQARLTKAGL